jgi:hypothetical protein
MPSLEHSLQGRDLGHLRIVAEQWGHTLTAPDTRVGLQRVLPLLLDAETFDEVYDTFDDATQDALAELMRANGRLPWAVFTQRYGEIRKMGAGRRNRERPDQAPVSIAETLWYHALIARNFFDTEDGPQEFAYLPDDWLFLLPSPDARPQAPLGRPATPTEYAHVIPATDHLLDDATSLLAHLRAGKPLDTYPLTGNPLSPHVLRDLLSAASIVGDDGIPEPKPTRNFLRRPRGQALAQLVTAWHSSTSFDEVRQLPGLVAEGDWENFPQRTRQRVLSFLTHLPNGAWWNINALIAAIKMRQPDYQRPSSTYDTFYLREAESDEFLQGFVHWERVDGALIRYFVEGPLFALGLVELAAPESDGLVTAFRLTPWALDLLAGTPPHHLADETGKLTVRSNGLVSVPRHTPRAVRYQIARFCVWEHEKADPFLYRITPASLKEAVGQGLKVSHLITLLANNSEGIPPNVTQALRRWERAGTQVQVEKITVLRLGDPEILTALRKTRAARFLSDPLGPTSVIIKPGAEDKVLAVLMEMGWLGEIIG